MANDPMKLPMGRRRLLALGGGALAAGAFATSGGRIGAMTRRPSGLRVPRSGDLPTIQQWYHQYGEEGTQAAVERYAAAYEDADVEVTWQPGDYDQTTVASLLTDDGPDVFEYGNGPTIDMIQSEQVVPMTDLFTDETRADFNQSVLGRMTYQDEIWAIPQVIDMQILVYNTQMLEDAGIDPPETIDDLIAAAAELTKDGVKGLYLGNNGGADLMGGPMLWAAGLNYLTEDNEFGFDDPKAVEAFSKLRELWESDSLLLGQPTDWWAADAMVSQQTAMQFTGLWTFPDLDEGLPDGYGAIPWPMMEGGAKSVPVGAYGSCVSAKAGDVDAAKAFAQWLWIDQTEHQLDFATAYGFHIPSRTSLVSEASTLAEGPAADAAAAAEEFGVAQNQLLWTPASNAAFGDMMSRIVKDGADPEEEIAALKEIVDEELARVTG